MLNWPFCFNHSKTGRTAKAQPIWMKFCTHTHTHLLYGIHLWADLDRDRRVGDSS